MTFKCTIFFKDKDESAGWTETYYRDESLVTDCLARLEELANLRSDLLGAGVNIPAIRVSDEAVYRDSFVKAFQPALTNTAWADVPEAAPPWTAILVRLQSGATARRPLFMRGAPGPIVAEPEAIFSEPKWNRPYNKWEDEIRGGSWKMKGINLAEPSYKIFDVVVGAPPALPSLSPEVAFPGAAAETKVRIGRFNTIPGFNGVYTVLSAPPGGPIVLRGLKNPTYLVPPGVYNGRGYIRKLITVYPTINRVDVERLVSRNTGRPFDTLHGRRSTRRT